MCTARDGDQEQSGCTLRKLGPRRVIFQTALEYVREDGTQCPVLHDKYAHHAACCESGGGLLRRHNALRDLLAKLLADDLGAVVAIEQRVPQLDRTTRQGRVEEAILDIIANIDGQSWLIDVSVVSPQSLDRQLVRGAARQDGFMAAHREDDERNRYDHQ